MYKYLIMAKQYQIFFDENTTDTIERIAKETGAKSGRQWMIDKIMKAVQKYRESAKAFELNEYVFLLKDGSYKRGSGANAGAAWRAMGYSTEEAPEKMEAYKTLAQAQEAGWPLNAAVSPQTTQTSSEPQIVAETPKEVAPDEDLPFDV